LKSPAEIPYPLSGRFLFFLSSAGESLFLAQRLTSTLEFFSHTSQHTISLEIVLKA
jgi:hypothetical protein